MVRRTISRIEHDGRIALHLFDPSETGRPHAVEDRRAGAVSRRRTYADLASAEEHYDRLADEIRGAMPRNAGGGFGTSRPVGSFGRRGGCSPSAPKVRTTAAPVASAETPYLEFRMRGGRYDAFATAGGHDAPLVEGIAFDVLPVIRVKLAELQRSGVLERVHFSDAALAALRRELKAFAASPDADVREPPAGPGF